MTNETSSYIVGLTGSGRPKSNTYTVVQTVLDAAADAGAETDHIDVITLDLPMLDITMEETPAAAVQMTETIEAADGVVLGSPMYHGSFSGTLKTALDYCGFDEFDETTVALVGVSGGQFPRVTVEHLRTVAATLRADVLSRTALVPSTRQSFTDDGHWDNEQLEGRAQRIGHELVEAVEEDA